MKLNLNLLAQEVAAMEGKKKQVNIAQIKEIIKCTFAILGRHWVAGNENAVIDKIKKAALSRKQQ